MSNKPTPCKGLNIRIPTIIPMKGRGFIHHAPTLAPNKKPANPEQQDVCMMLARNLGVRSWAFWSSGVALEGSGASCVIKSQSFLGNTEPKDPFLRLY